jgi:hypothetical protein
MVYLAVSFWDFEGRRCKAQGLKVRSETHYLIALAKRRQVLKSVWILALNPKRIKARKDQTDDKGEQQTMGML